MASIEFEVSPETETQSVELHLEKISLDRSGYYDDGYYRTDRVGPIKSAYLHYNEKASGSLIISNTTELEAEALKRAVFVSNELQEPNLSHSLHDRKSRRPDWLDLSKDQQIDMLETLENGQVTTSAQLTREDRLKIGRKGYALGEQKLIKPHIRSYAGNLNVVRDSMLQRIGERYQTNGTEQPRHDQEIAKTANDLGHEILEVVTPKLVAVHGLTVAILETRLADQMASV